MPMSFRGMRDRLIEKTAGRLAENIDKEGFLEQLKVAWYPLVKKGSDIEIEVGKARERISKAGPYGTAFAKLGLTDDDLRGILKEIQDSKPEQVIRKQKEKVGRNEPCPCGSGKKYKKCCGS